MLIKGYYNIADTRQQEDGSVVFDVILNPDCEVYKGHFPEEPISPGVCNLQMIRECAEIVAGCPLVMGNIILCRFLNLVTPVQTPRVSIRIKLDKGESDYTLVSSIYNEDKEFVSLKAKLSW